MSAITRSPARRSAGGSTSGTFGAASVTVIVASMLSPGGSWESADRPARQVDGHDRDPRAVDIGDDRLEDARDRSAEAGAEDGVDDQIAARDLREVQLPRLRVGDLDDGQAEAAERSSRLTRASPRTSATEPSSRHEQLDAALRQRARDDEAVAAVAAAAAQHRHASAGAHPRTTPRSPRRPADRRSPSARATECRCPRSSGDPPRASAPR